MLTRKSLLTVFGLAIFAFTAQAQKKSGAIQYETQVDPVAAAEASGFPMSEEMKARMPKSIKANYELLFNSVGASYMPVVETEDSNGGGRMGGPGRMMMRFGGFGGGNREYYYNFADKKVVEAFDIMDTSYVMNAKLTIEVAKPQGGFRNNNQQAQSSNNGLVQFSTEPPKLEVINTDETKKILNLDCKKTIFKISRKAKILDMDKEIVEEINVWHTDALGFDFSPDPNLWAGGTVLSIEKKGGNITATSIEYRKVSNSDVTAPKKAIAITPEEYQAKMEAMANRFRNMRGGQPNRSMRITIQ